MGNIYQLKITLKDVKPSIWRRIQVKDNLNFLELSTIVQIAMGWEGIHKHMFVIGDEEIGYTDDDKCDSKDHKIKKYLHKENTKFIYEYNFGDGWEHDVEVEAILPIEETKQYPFCIEGKRHCPPENCGGPWAYEDLIGMIKDKKHPDHQKMIEKFGKNFKPEKFDITEINSKLLNYKNFIKLLS
ncbi:MAG: plasmid pRiA4b ORF-3 family protein [Bacteroidota bacterium]|nr:plasmid pRiA4b ORF-3 family protein [Bacteroidota bacterium]